MIRNLACIMFLLSCAAAVAGDPALPGHHPLSQIQAGSLLMAELRCVACHADVPQEHLLEKSAPDLTEVGTRVSAEFLQSFLASPSTAHPGTTMPDMLASKSASERPVIAESLTHFLISQSQSSSPSETVGSMDRQLGQELFHSIGCVACHGPKETPTVSSEVNLDEEEDEEEEWEELDPVKAARKTVKPSAIGLGHVSAKYTVRSLSDFLFQPLKVRSSGRMPDMKLTPTESLAIAGYLVGEQNSVGNALVPNAELVESGRGYFRELNCAACHALPGFEAAPSVISLKTAELTRGCLEQADESAVSSKASIKSPRFKLDVTEISAIVAAIRAEQIVESDKDRLAITLTAFRCVNCHVRDEYGGVHDAHNAFFKGTQPNLGDDGRVPPPLTLMGAKLQSSWMKKVLFDGESVRHYMATRMPQYGAGNLHQLPERFQALDVLSGPEMKMPKSERATESEREEEKLIRAAGRELLGDKGANCVACHKFNSKAADGNLGIDLLTSTERLQPAWFYHYLQNPGAFRPRTVMPTAWPEGKAAFTKILDGDTHRQLEAIWYYLSLGTSAADPSGVRAEATKLTVENRANVHRGRSRVAGFRGIAVGLPEGLNYAFNAETGALSAIWLGEFVTVNWSGQGSGDFNPIGKAVTLPQDVSFVVLGEKNSPWPRVPQMTKESPVNPDPLYPKNVGYQFQGYFLDERSIPTFQYRSGSIAIEDRSVANDDGASVRLFRSITFSSEAAQTVWFRTLVGDIQRESERVFRCGQVRLTIPATEAIIRPLTDQPQQSELLLRLQVPQGKSTLEFLYEPLNL